SLPLCSALISFLLPSHVVRQSPYLLCAFISYSTLTAFFTLSLHDALPILFVGGELVRVTSISGTGTTQTFTVQRATNGIRKPHAAGTEIRLYRGAIVGL